MTTISVTQFGVLGPADPTMRVITSTYGPDPFVQPGPSTADVNGMLDRVITHPDLTFQLRTQDPPRLRDAMVNFAGSPGAARRRFPNLWVGFHAHLQAPVNRIVDHLVDVPAGRLFMHLEPQAQIDLRRVLPTPGQRTSGQPGVDWVVVGGQTGLGAQPLLPQWVADIADACDTAAVPLYLTTLGEYTTEAPDDQSPAGWVDPRTGMTVAHHTNLTGRDRDTWTPVYHVGVAATGRRVDGRTFDATPTRAGTR